MPEELVSVWPTVFVPVIAGMAVACGGKNPETIAVVTVAVSTAFTPPTLTRICRFATSNVGEYVEVVAPSKLIHEIPSEDFCH